MKISKLFIFFLILHLTTQAQVPQKMSYQAIVRNAQNELIQDKSIGIKVSILKDTNTGEVVYIEQHNVMSNTAGLVTLKIGDGQALNGQFKAIDWKSGAHFIKTEVDLTGGQNYTLETISELLSVPYALNSANVTVSGFTHYIGELYDGGVVFYVYKGADGLEHGLIVALNETRLSWQNTPKFTGADRTDDGLYNTSKMSDSQIKAYAEGVGNGWYLPSIDELKLLYVNRFLVQKKLRSLEGTGAEIISQGFYWSSTEGPEYKIVAGTYNEALTFTFGYAYIYSSYKLNVDPVRLIKAF